MAIEIAIPPTGPSRPEPPPTRPEAIVEAIVSVPRTTSRTSARRREVRKSGRSRKGTAQTRSSACSVASTTPKPAHSEPTMPIASATPLPSSELTWICSPITGNWVSTESTASWRRSGLPAST